VCVCVCVFGEILPTVCQSCAESECVLWCVASEATASPTPHPTLAESAALQQAKQSHVELQEVEVVTGEENESNVFQVASLLHGTCQYRCCFHVSALKYKLCMLLKDCALYDKSQQEWLQIF